MFKSAKLTLKFLFYFILFTVSFAVVASLLFKYFLSARELQLMRERARNIAVAMAKDLNVSEHETLQTQADENSVAYSDLMMHLKSAVAHNPEVSSVYTLRPTSQKNYFSFVLDSQETIDKDNNGVIDATEKRADIGELYDIRQSPQMAAGFSEPTADVGVTSDKWGQWISGYAPLKDSSGISVAVVGVDLSANSYYQSLAYINSLIYFLLLLAAVLGLIFGFLGLGVFKYESKQIYHQAKVLSAIIDQAPFGIYTVGSNGIIESFNPKMVELAGIKSPKEIIGINALEYSPHKQYGLDKYFRAGLLGQEFDYETPYTSFSTGKETYRHYRGVPIFSPDGKAVERLLLIVSDITERKKMQTQLESYTHDLETKVKARTVELAREVAVVEKQKQAAEKTKQAVLNIMRDLKEAKTNLENAKAKDEALLESISEGVVALDPARKIILWNRIAEELSGWKSREVFGKYYNEILKFKPEITYKVDNSFIEKAYESREPTTMESAAVLTRKNGSTIAVAESASRVVDELGNVLGVIVIFRDVTHEREVDRMKTEFVSVASHQLRTPLAAIKWFLEMLQKGEVGKLTKQQHQFIDNMHESNERMISLVNDLLNVSRIEGGRIIIEPINQDLIELTNKIASEFKPRAADRGQKIVVRHQVDKIYLMVDESIFREVVSNLISNALKYSPDNSTVEIILNKSGLGIEIAVKDDGFGVPTAQQSKIFEKFFRADNALLKRIEGSGLGLYVVRSLLNEVGGTVDFVSEESRGSVFTITLPLEGMRPRGGEVSLN